MQNANPVEVYVGLVFRAYYVYVFRTWQKGCDEPEGSCGDAVSRPRVGVDVIPSNKRIYIHVVCHLFIFQHKFYVIHIISQF